MQGKNALALEALKRSAELEPHPATWGNMAACLRNMQRVDECRAVLEQGYQRAPWNAHIAGNLCGSYVNEGDPMPGIRWGELVKDDPEIGATARFNLGLLHLEAGNFAEGFDYYASGHHSLRRTEVYQPDPPMLTDELFAELTLGTGIYPDEQDKPRLLVWTEQGLGDELMMCTILEQAREDFQIVLDAHPRLQWLHQNSRWLEGAEDQIELHDTRKTKDKNWVHDCVAKISVGSLMRFYRRKLADFPELPHYPHPSYAAQYRDRLLAKARGRTIIGLATRGGVMSTARLYRVLPQEVIEQLFDREDLMFVSLDYEDMSQLASWARVKYGPDKFLWYPSIVWHWQYEQTAAMVAACDAVVSVPQTVAHLSAGMAHPTYVLTPSKPDWRMGLAGERWYWYPSDQVRLLRQQGQDWQPALSRLFELLQPSSKESA
jgi:tetratricopeptide (TPR) repeat protein